MIYFLPTAPINFPLPSGNLISPPAVPYTQQSAPDTAIRFRIAPQSSASRPDI